MDCKPQNKPSVSLVLCCMSHPGRVVQFFETCKSGFPGTDSCGSAHSRFDKSYILFSLLDWVYKKLRMKILKTVSRDEPVNCGATGEMLTEFDFDVECNSMENPWLRVMTRPDFFRHRIIHAAKA